MRQNRECPKCKGRKLYAVERARISDGQSANGTIDLALAAEYMSTGGGGFLGPKGEMIEAKIEAWICASCGFSELYADLDALAQLHANGAEGLRIVDATPGTDGAFR